MLRISSSVIEMSVRRRVHQSCRVSALQVRVANVNHSCQAVTAVYFRSYLSYLLARSAFVLSWSRSSNLGSITATSCLSESDFLPISNDVCRPYSTPQLTWYFDFVAMTTCLTLSRYCTGCVCQNGSTLNWRS